MAIKYIQQNASGEWVISNSKAGRVLRKAFSKNEAVRIAQLTKSTEGIMIRSGEEWTLAKYDSLVPPPMNNMAGAAPKPAAPAPTPVAATVAPVSPVISKKVKVAKAPKERMVLAASKKIKQVKIFKDKMKKIQTQEFQATGEIKNPRAKLEKVKLEKVKKVKEPRIKQSRVKEPRVKQQREPRVKRSKGERSNAMNAFSDFNGKVVERLKSVNGIWGLLLGISIIAALVWIILVFAAFM